MMNSRKSAKHWNCCPHCFQLVYSAGFGTGNHQCPKVVAAKKDAEIDMIIHKELSLWKSDLRQFWDSKDVKFYEYLADRKKI